MFHDRYLACSLICAMLSVFCYHRFYVNDHAANRIPVRIPVNIDPKDGVASIQILIKTRQSSSSPVQLRVGLDTGSSVSWFLDSSCQVHTSIVDRQLRQKLLVKSVATRHTTIAVRKVMTVPTVPLSVKYADGTRIKGSFIRKVLFFFSALVKQGHEQDQTQQFHALTWGSVTSVAETVRQTEDDSRFEQASVDGWLGLGRPPGSHSAYPSGHAFITSMAVLHQSQWNERGKYSNGHLTSWSMTFAFRRPPYALLIHTPAVVPHDGVQVKDQDDHWSVVVSKVAVNGCQATQIQYKVMFDVGAGSIFTPKDLVPTSCWANITKGNDTFPMSFMLANGKTVTIPHLMQNVSYHRTLRNTPAAPLVPLESTAPPAPPAPPTIVLGLPFFMRMDVTLTTIHDQHQHPSSYSYWAHIN